MIVFDGILIGFFMGFNGFFFFFGFLWVFLMGFQSSKGVLESGFHVA